MKVRYVAITPVRNEASVIQRTIDSMSAQTLLPARWVIVDDGSSDGTSEIVAAAASRSHWITALHRRDRGWRKSGGGVIEAFYDGFAAAADDDWQFLVKLDGDVSFSPDYFLQCLACFQQEPRLGIGGGTVCVDRDGQIVVESTGDPPFHVRGATKIYRRECWEEIAPLARTPGWDTIDEAAANMAGWTTRTFADLRLVQHKPTGHADGAWRNWFKNGRGCYMAGYDPLFMLGKCAKRLVAKPPLIPVLALASGFCSGYLMRIPRACDARLRRYLRRQQRRRLLLRRSIYG